jgi:hypothetical protein
MVNRLDDELKAEAVARGEPRSCPVRTQDRVSLGLDESADWRSIPAVNRSLRRVFVPAAMLALLGIPARAEDASTPSDASKNWEIRFAPIYLWAPINSTSASEGEDAPDVDVTQGQTGLNGAYGMRLEIEPGRSIVSLEEMYASITNESTSASGIHRSLDYKILLSELDSLSVLGGLRYYVLRLEYTSTNSSPIDQDGSFFDPVVGLWYRPQISRHWMATVGADVGGFGVGFDISSSVFATFSWRDGKRFGLDLGYRALYMNKSAPRESLETIFYGPVFGLEIYF